MFVDDASDQIVFTPTGELQHTGKIRGMHGLGRINIGVTGVDGVHRVRVFAEVDGSLVPVLHVGPDARGSLCCLVCTQPFRDGEAWHMLTSAADPEYGTYTVGLHEFCPVS